MPYLFNIASFKSVRHANGVDLLAKCYNACVYLELCLKSDPTLLQYAGPVGHGIPGMLRHVHLSSHVPSGTVTALAQRLENALKNLWHQNKQQNPAPVNPAVYPHMRYLRHINDWAGSPQASLDSDLEAVLTLLDEIFVALRAPNTTLPL